MIREQTIRFSGNSIHTHSQMWSTCSPILSCLYQNQSIIFDMKCKLNYILNIKKIWLEKKSQHSVERYNGTTMMDASIFGVCWEWKRKTVHPQSVGKWQIPIGQWWRRQSIEIHQSIEPIVSWRKSIQIESDADIQFEYEEDGFNLMRWIHSNIHNHAEIELYLRIEIDNSTSANDSIGRDWIECTQSNVTNANKERKNSYNWQMTIGDEDENVRVSCRFDQWKKEKQDSMTFVPYKFEKEWNITNGHQTEKEQPFCDDDDDDNDGDDDVGDDVGQFVHRVRFRYTKEKEDKTLTSPFWCHISHQGHFIPTFDILINRWGMDTRIWSKVIMHCIVWTLIVFIAPKRRRQQRQRHYSNTTMRHTAIITQHWETLEKMYLREWEWNWLNEWRRCSDMNR